MRPFRNFMKDFLLLFCFILAWVAIIEFVNHGASWDGVYKAHELHKRNASMDILMGR